MKNFESLRNLLRIPTEDEPLLRAQLRALERQVPLLYIILLVSVWGVVVHLIGDAPPLLTLWLPVLLTMVVASRIYALHRASRDDYFPIERVIRKLKALIAFTVIMTVALGGWAWSLDNYASPLQRTHLSFFVAVTLIASTFALAQFPPAAIYSIFLGGLTFNLFCISRGDLVNLGLGLNFSVVLLVFALLMRTFHRAFVSNVHANFEMTRLNAELVYHRDNLAGEVRKRTAELEAQALKLEQALSQEKELNQIQNQFVSMVSHEFRTPLTIIDGSARRVEKNLGRMPDGQLAERMTRIRGAVRRLSNLVERTLDASKLANGAIECAPVDFALEPFLVEIADRHADIASAEQLETDFHDLPDTLHGDPNLIDHIISNLLSNAVKYSGKAARIKFSAVGEGGELILSVRDNGVGIPASELSRITERFYRASTSKGIPGTGIGLNLAASLVRMHGGHMRIDSVEGEWTEVQVRLPVSEKQRESNSDTPDRQAFA